MTIYAIANWNDGEVAIETVVTRITAYTHTDVRDVTLVGVVGVTTVEAIRRALVGELAALDPTSTSPVETTASVVVTIAAYSAPAADGSRRPARAVEALPIGATEAEVRSVSQHLMKSVVAQLERLASKGSVIA